MAGVLLLVGDGPSDAVPQGANLLPRPYRPVNWAALEWESIRNEFGDID